MMVMGPGGPKSKLASKLTAGDRIIRSGHDSGCFAQELVRSPRKFVAFTRVMELVFHPDEALRTRARNLEPNILKTQILKRDF